MPKKARRGSARYGGPRKARKPGQAVAQTRQEVHPPVETRAVGTSRPSGRTPATVAAASRPQYGYVMSDLRRIGILVVAAAAILIILAFVLR